MPPVATYRLQFHAGFTFDAATRIVDYLDALGISHVYASSYLKAVPGSLHGYDVADPTQLNPEIGSDETYAAWVDALRARGMGHIIDLVPNHMGIAGSANAWWQDVLENGPSSRYAPVFDIDWHPLKPELDQKVLLPVLGDAYGAVLERQEIRLEYDDGAFRARYYEHTFPIAPGTYDRILGIDHERLLEDLGPESEEAVEVLSILTAIRHLPSQDVQEPDLLAERDREKEVIKRRLAALTARAPRVRAHIEHAVATLNGTPGVASSFDALDDLLDAQAYRLAHWRVAAEEINYRRFFDINELAAIRVEDPAVFDRVHALPFELLQRGCLDGFRIDHVDGLYDPGDYLQRLRARALELRPDLAGSDASPGGLYLVVEKILGVDEPLPDWPIDGTTGYDFMVMLNGLFVDTRHERAMNDTYERFTGLRVPYREIAYRGKQLMLRVSMASELNVLAHRLNRFSEGHRYYRDFTLNSLSQAMREIIACFPVYRTYVNDREPEVSERDRTYIERAVGEAKRRNPNRPAAVYNFVRDLLLRRLDDLPDEERGELRRFVGKFQQVTSPVTAKGIEDTAFYVYNRLVSLNDVGGAPDRFGVTPDALHAWFAERARRWPHGLSTTSTHDTKRSEDVRARLNVLSEMPAAWRQATARWARANRRARSVVDGVPFPGRNEEYLLYQTLVGSWPPGPMTPEDEQMYRERIHAYMIKAMREAKIVTSWINPSQPHEEAMTRFVDAVLAPEHGAFRRDFLEFERRIARLGLYTSLAQLVVKIGAPGVPDFYQGTDLWDFSLVDPDNRRPVDFERRRALLAELDAEVERGDRAALAARLVQNPDDRLKLYVTATLLRGRRKSRDVFERGGYGPLRAEGTARDHVFAFARVLDGTARALVAVPRLLASLAPESEAPPLGADTWGDTRIVIDELAAGVPEPYCHLLTGRRIQVQRENGHAVVLAADLFADMPIGFCLESGM